MRELNKGKEEKATERRHGFVPISFALLLIKPRTSLSLRLCLIKANETKGKGTKQDLETVDL